MPRKPKRPCSQPGCPELTHEHFCDEHRKAEARRYERYQRDTNTAKRYGRAWITTRERYPSMNPLCEVVKRNSKLTSLQKAQHNLPLSRGGTHDESNLMSVCTPCHSSITARDGDRWRRSRG